MKRSASGRASLQASGVLKPRNEPFTPTSRESGAQAVRKSYIPKAGLGGSAKRLAVRRGRGSTENMPRLSIASTRFTPTRTNTPACAPQSVNRLSTDARNSGIGTSARKDTRHLNDPTHKTQCINKIMQFLSSNGRSYQRRTLLTPSTNDFKDIFNCIYQHLDPNYTLPQRFEEEIPKLMKNIHCPYQLTKSSFVSVGSPHTWPVVLASLAFMVDFVHINSIMESSIPEDDLDEDTASRLEACVEAYKCRDDAEEDACIEAHIERIKIEHSVSEKDMVDLAEAVEAVEQELEMLPKVADELKHLKQCNVQYSDDLIKLHNYLQDLKVAINNKVVEEKNKKQAIEELSIKEHKISEEINRLKTLRSQQAYSTSELMRLKNHSQEASKEIEYQEQLGKELCNQVWNLEMEVSKSESILRNSTVQLENLLEKLSLSQDFSGIDWKSEDVFGQFDDIMGVFMTHKKVAKKTNSQVQERVLKLGQDVERAKVSLQEAIAEGNMLKTKTRHADEENEITREEIQREDQLKLNEIEELHQKIMDARKTQKNRVYHLQLDEEINNKKLELENSKKKEEKCAYDGLQFLKKFSEDELKFAEDKRKCIAESTTRMKAELAKFLEWMNSPAIEI